MKKGETEVNRTMTTEETHRYFPRIQNGERQTNLLTELLKSSTLTDVSLKQRKHTDSCEEELNLHKRE